MIFPKSNKNFAWIDSLGHKWVTTPNSRTSGRGCPYCSGNKVLKGFNDLSTTHPEIAAEWHPTKNGSIQPTEVSKGHTKKIWWKCAKCGYDYESYIGNRIKGYGKCPNCSRKKNGT